MERKETQNEAEKLSEKFKKMEKSSADLHREYLDMDTDEEEFGKPETPEPEEEPPPEPERPIFTDEELEELVHYVKDFTVLPALDNSDWNEDCCKVIRQFFQDPSTIVLSIFYDVDVLKALLDFPSDAVEGLTYFLRSPWQIYTPENFHTTINFGSISGNVENYLLKIMENVFSLSIFNCKDWPSVKRNDIFTSTHDLQTKLTDTTYSLMGLTVLYVPREGIDSDTISKTEEQNQFVLVNADDESNQESSEDIEEINEAKDKGELLGRVETVVNCWIRQIRQAIADQNSASKLSKIEDELTFWKYRYDNLQGLHCQLQNNNILRIVKKLENVKLTSIKQFYDLSEAVKEAIEEASSNIRYLNLLTAPCAALDIPEIKEEQISEILYLISFIWLESPYYNSKTKIEVLCRTLSTQIVGACRESINLNAIFQGDTIDGKKILEICINCCEKYKSFYDKHVEVISKISHDSINWEVVRENVLNCVDAFVRRCQDVIEICNMIVVFGRSSISISFGGSNGVKYESDCSKIEKLFYESLQDIEKVQHKILDVTEATWIEHITLFRCQTTELEVMVKNLINSIFDDTNCIEESIEALYTLQRYNQCGCINELLHFKWVDIWKNFDYQMQQSKHAIVEHSEEYHSSTPCYSGRASKLRLQQSRLTRYQTILINASDWIGDCEAQIPILRNYKKLMAAIANEERLLFDEWEKTIGEEKDLINIFSEPILRRAKSNVASIEVNMNYHLLDTLEEAEVWLSLNYEVKPQWKKLSTKWSILMLRYKAAILLCRSYNRIFKKLSNDERLLFKELLKSLDNLIASGFDKITWNSPDIERFYTDCTVEISNLQDFIGLYGKANSRIIELFEEISNIRFFKIPNKANCKIETFLTVLENYKREGMQKITKCYECILRLLMGIKEGFETDFEEMQQYWNNFTQAKDCRLEESLCSAVTASLQSILKFIREDEIDGDKALFQIIADYVDDQLIICGDLQKINEIFENVSKYIIEDLEPLELLSKKLNIEFCEDLQIFRKSIEKHYLCLNLQEEINSEINDLNKSVTEYLNSIDCLEEISAIDVHKITEYYTANEPNREILETDIQKCTKLADSIENIANKVPINFLVLDMKEAKVKMMEKCESWREVLLIELSKVIVAEQKFDAISLTPVEELSLYSYMASDESD